ncbi:MAG: ABC transporter permease [Myxococcota bacterium]
MSDTPAPTPKKPWINWQQSGVLADRYMETILADWVTTLLLVLQAPLLAGMAVAVWGNLGEANVNLYFVMTLSCLWIGCMDACREIVKERAQFMRERMFNLDISAYLFSKIRVLLLLNVVQVVAYAVIIDANLETRVHVVWLVLNLLVTTLTGTCLGLLISAASRRSDYAVALVPLVILPQILFSEVAISKDSFEGYSEWVYTLMPSRWGFEGLKELAKTEPEYIDALGMMVPLLGFSLLFLVAAWPLLRFQRY